jgi:head-tail adaptor
VTAPIGRLSSRIGLEAPLRAGDEIGGASLGFAHVAQIWARLSPLETSESFDEGGPRVRRRWSCEIRTRTDVAPGWRVSRAALRLRVVAVGLPEGGRIQLLLGEAPR